MKLLLNSTPVALWREVLLEAQSLCSTTLQEEIESYLVFLLIRYTTQPEALKSIIATEFLSGLKMPDKKKHLVFSSVGDQCLLFSGLFPGMAEKRMVKVSYFVNIGQAAYFALSKTRHDLYGSLSTEFVHMMDVLQSIRHYDESFPDLLPLMAYDQWNDLGSQRALHALTRHTKGTPLSDK